MPPNDGMLIWRLFYPSAYRSLKPPPPRQNIPHPPNSPLSYSNYNHHSGFDSKLLTKNRPLKQYKLVSLQPKINVERFE